MGLFDNIINAIDDLEKTATSIADKLEQSADKLEQSAGKVVTSSQQIDSKIDDTIQRATKIDGAVRRSVDGISVPRRQVPSTKTSDDNNSSDAPSVPVKIGD